MQTQMQTQEVNNRNMNAAVKQTQMHKSMIAQTQKFLRNVSDYKKRHQPIELQIQPGGGLKKESSEGRIVNIDLPAITIENNELIINNLQKHDGLIAEQLFVSRRLLTAEVEKSVIPNQILDLQTKIMICITMFSEPLNELQKTIHAIEESLQDFYDHGITSNQITIIVLFDGIEHIRNQNDENGKNIDQDIIPFFCQTFDKPYQIEEKRTLEHLYKKYKFYKDNLKKYSKEQREQFKKLTLDQQKNFLRNDRYLRSQIYSTEKFSLTQQEVQKVVEKMEELQNKSQKWIDSKQNNAHVYQTCYKVRTLEREVINEMNIYYVFKYANGTKLSSHLWFFKGFCKEFNPEYCVLMDCGAIPQKGSVFKLVNEMITNPRVGGVCGTMTIQLQEEVQSDDNMDFVTKILTSIFSIQRCQKCEYDIGNTLDKQFESSLNFIQVLPGAYSAYRYKAFEQKYNQDENENQRESILNYYLKSKLDPNYEHQSIDEANMFLAEDRVLCLSLFCNSYYLQYVRDAHVEVDPCQTLIMLLFQRRRWINGSWFALNYVINTFYQKLHNSGHSTYDKFKFYLCLVFARLSQGQQYFTVSMQVIWLYMVLNTILSDSDPIINSAVKQFIIGLYIFFVFNLIILSMFFNPSVIQQIANSAEREKERNKLNLYFYSKFYGISTILGLLSLANAIYTVYLFISEIMVNQYFLLFLEQPHVLSAYIYLFVAISLFLTILPFILQLFIDPLSVLSIAINSIHYIYFQPTYTHLFLIYSFCRIDDLSWGTKGLVIDQQNAQSSSKYEKYLFVLKWVTSNVIFSTSIYLLFYLNIQFIYVGIILIFSVGFTIIQFCKLIGFFAFWIQQIKCKIQSPTINNDPHAQARRKSREKSLLQQNIKKQMYKCSEEPINLTQQANNG